VENREEYNQLPIFALYQPKKTCCSTNWSRQLHYFNHFFTLAYEPQFLSSSRW